MLEILVVKTVFSTIFNELLKLPKLFNVGVTVSVNVPLTCEIFYEIDYNMYRL